MNKIDSAMATAIRKSLRLIEDNIESEPAVFIDAGGGHWFNDPAEKIIQKNGILVEEFLDWLRIGSSHLRQINCCGLGIQMMRITEEEILVFLRRQGKTSADENFNLTRKEKEVLGHVVRGLTNRKIAEIMKISAGTVNSHLDKIYFKLGCSSRLSACYIALKHGLFMVTGEALSE